MQQRRSDLHLYRAVFFGAVDAMLILDDDRSVVEANTAACALFGVAQRAIQGRPFASLIVEDNDLECESWRELLALGEAKREHRVPTPDGERLIECSYRASVDRGRHLCIARDITDRRAIDERLAQSEKIESIGRLAGGIAHDFNNLLTAILGYSEILLGDRADNDPDRADLEEIQRAGQRAAALTQQLLAFGRKQILVPTNVDLNDVIAALHTMLTRLIREDISLSWVPAASPAVVRVDPLQIEQALLNLVLNARDGMPIGGHIRLEAARVLRSQVHARDRQSLGSNAAEFIRLRVVDDGTGISPEARAHLFEPFYTTRTNGQGTGLGLASVYGVIRQSGGVISVDSEPGRGTTFTIYFPAAGGTDGVASTAQSGPADARQTILLVEDEDSVRVIIAAILRKHGYNVLEAPTTRAACDIFMQRGHEIALLLTDVVMPEMNGPALAQRLIGLRPELRVLMISGYAGVSMQLLPSNRNISFLGKPFQAATLANRVRAVLS